MNAHDMENLPPNEKNPPSDAENEAEETPIQFDLDDFLQICEVF